MIMDYDNPQFFFWVVFYRRSNHQPTGVWQPLLTTLQCRNQGSKQDQAFTWGELIGREKGEGIELRNGKDMDMIDRNMNMDMNMNQWSMQYAWIDIWIGLDWIQWAILGAGSWLSYPFQKNTAFCSHCQLDSESYTFRSNMKSYLKPQTQAAGIEAHQATSMMKQCVVLYSLKITGNTNRNTSFDFGLTTNTQLETLFFHAWNHPVPAPDIPTHGVHGFRVN